MAENEKLRIIDRGPTKDSTLRKMAKEIVGECCLHCIASDGNPCLANTPNEVIDALNNNAGICEFAAIEAEKAGYVYTGILYKVANNIGFEPVGLPIKREEYYHNLLLRSD